VTRRLPWSFDRIMGLLLSCLWPLILIAIAVSSHRDRRNAG